MRRLFSCVVIVLALAGCSLGQPADDASGEEIYAELCARCHGADLSGGVAPPLDAGSNAAIESDEYLEFTISNGRGRMPSFPSLDAGQIDRLIEYMRQVQGS